MLGFFRNHLNPSKMRGQAYGRASNMSGKTNGAEARISSQYSLSLYTHCTSHCLNLAVVPSFEEVSVHNMIGVVKRLSIFFFLHSPSIRISWKKLYRTPSQNWTCWSSKISAEQDGLNRLTLDRIKKLYTSIVACFENISAEGSRMWSPDSVTDASTLLLVITRT